MNWTLECGKILAPPPHPRYHSTEYSTDFSNYHSTEYSTTFSFGKISKIKIYGLGRVVVRSHASRVFTLSELSLRVERQFECSRLQKQIQNFSFIRLNPGILLLKYVGFGVPNIILNVQTPTYIARWAAPHFCPSPTNIFLYQYLGSLKAQRKFFVKRCWIWCPE